MSQTKLLSWEIQQAMKAARAAALQAKYPQLVPVNDGDRLTTAAKNVRIELKAAFPAVKFSVKTRRFSMGDAIDVSWTDGPNADQVDAIIGKYKSGTFNGMTDGFEYSDSAWKDAFGEGKFVHASRKLSPVLSARMEKIVRAKYGIAADMADGVDMVRKFGFYLADETYRTGRRHSCALAQMLFDEENVRPQPSVIPYLSIVRQ